MPSIMLRITALVLVLAATPVSAADIATTTAANAINTLGIELLARVAKPDQNALLSPYSIQSALAMTYAGADGVTRAEMAKVLHYPKDEAELHRSFAALRKALDAAAQASAKRAEQAKRWGATNDPITLTVANRLFGQSGCDFREPFLALLRNTYTAPFEPLDFVKDAAGATKHINGWVEDQTRQRIRNLIPDGALNRLTRLVLVNAVYLKAPWAAEFDVGDTKLLPFHVAGGGPEDVPTMKQQHSFGYAKGGGFSAVVLPYDGAELQFLVLLPDKLDGLAELEAKLSARLLAQCAGQREREIVLYLPRFKLEPPVVALGRELQALGMKSAFDPPPGSANFQRISEQYLFIAEVFHKTFLNLDEQGTEAAAATTVGLTMGIYREPPKPITVRVDHPFLFAIQHRASGACLFLGRVVDSR
jgi:serpin B